MDSDSNNSQVSAKSQKGSKTNSTHDDRHFVRHDYHDHSQDTMHDFLMSQLDKITVGVRAESEDGGKKNAKKQGGRPRGGVVVPFPTLLHLVISNAKAEGFAHIISWRSHGRCFNVHKPKEFVEKVMPVYFSQTKFTSFQRQLNIYGFSRLTTGRDRGCYYHELFLKHKLFFCQNILRIGIKGTGVKGKANPKSEPDFYSMLVVKPDPEPKHDIGLVPNPQDSSVTTSKGRERITSKQAFRPSEMEPRNSESPKKNDLVDSMISPVQELHNDGMTDGERHLMAANNTAFPWEQDKVSRDNVNTPSFDAFCIQEENHNFNRHENKVFDPLSTMQLGLQSSNNYPLLNSSSVRLDINSDGKHSSDRNVCLAFRQTTRTQVWLPMPHPPPRNNSSRSFPVEEVSVHEAVRRRSSSCGGVLNYCGDFPPISIDDGDFPPLNIGADWDAFEGADLDGEISF